MDDFDDAMLSFALQDAFPRVVFHKNCSFLSSPQLQEASSIPECADSQVHIYFPPENWVPCFRPCEKRPDRYLLVNSPRHCVYYDRSRWFWGTSGTRKWSFSLPTPETGQTSAPYDPDVPEDRVFVRQVWKVFNKLMTNKLKGGLDKDSVVLMRDAKGGDIWAGPHVLEWCRQDPHRMLAGCRRPCDDWKPPDSPWHDDLRKRVIEKFGPDFGGRPPSLEPSATFLSGVIIQR